MLSQTKVISALLVLMMAFGCSADSPVDRDFDSCVAHFGELMQMDNRINAQGGSAEKRISIEEELRVKYPKLRVVTGTYANDWHELNVFLADFEPTDHWYLARQLYTLDSRLKSRVMGYLIAKGFDPFTRDPSGWRSSSDILLYCDDDLFSVLQGGSIDPVTLKKFRCAFRESCD